VRFYAYGKALTNHSTLLIKQAELVSNEKKHIAVARKMYQLRFKEDVSRLTMQQLRGREGSRVRSLYKNLAKQWNVVWNGRSYKTDDYENSDQVNKSLSAGNACLYGLAHAVICALGCSPGLGFVHVGHELSFVYDIADLYKAETTIPVAFELASNDIEDIGSETRRKLRDIFSKSRIIERMVCDIKYILSEEEFNQSDSTSTLYLWDNKGKNLEHGVLYDDSGEET
jgi:CRISPR-associated protein Cas1